MKYFEYLKERFSTKMFIVFAVLSVIMSAIFTIVFISREVSYIEGDLIKDGEALSYLLSSSSRTAVFAENTDMLKDIAGGAISQENVLSVAIFTPDKRLLFSEQKDRSPKRSVEIDEKKHNSINRLTGPHSLEIIDRGDKLEFIRPVVISTPLMPEEAMYFSDNDSKKREKIIGFIEITLDKTGKKRAIKTAIISNTFIAVIFLFFGAIFIYIISKWVTMPLVRLTGAVKTLGQKGFADEVSVGSKDEIGRLATAFNVMIEDLKKREEENRLLEEKLSQARKMEAIGQFAGGIAHDFNNRLAAIMNYGYILRMKIQANDPLRNYVDQLLSSAEKAAELTQNILAFGKRQVIKLKPVNLNDVIKKAERLILKIIGEGIEYKTSLTDRSLITMVDAGQIERVLINLAVNAKDAMPDGGILSVGSEIVELDDEYIKTRGYDMPGKYALLSVTDSGIGMTEEVRQRIFEPFFTTKEIWKGTGLGLSIVYGIIEQHKGYIECYSEPGKGTTFKIYLSLTEATAPEAEAPIFIDSPRGTETVLLAEDDPDIRDATKDILINFGYKVIVASDGEDAIEKFIENKDDVQLLMLDLVMPKKNGKEVYEEIKKTMPEVKTIFLSGFDGGILDKEGLPDKGVDFISKPVLPGDLLRRVRETLDR